MGDQREPRQQATELGWRAPTVAEQQTLLAELHRELPASHPLARADLSVLFRRDDCDDVLLELADGRIAAVHLTWQTETEPDFPHSVVYPSIQAWLETDRSERSSGPPN